jgi:transcriptional regulator with XRE-family HTH domain
MIELTPSINPPCYLFDYSIPGTLDSMTDIDLSTLGAALRARRKSLRMPSAQLARRIEVSPTYIWLIEQAKPRSSGEPSRPSEELLLRWMRALGMDREEMYRMMELAGYFAADLDAPAFPRGRTMHSPKPFSEGELAMPNERQYAEGTGMLETMLDVGLADVSTDARTRVWRRSEGEETGVEERLVERTRQLLRDAAARGRRDEVWALLDSYLRWLTFHLENTREP